MSARALAVVVVVLAAASTARAETAIATVAGVRCFDVRTTDGGCVVSQQVSAVWRYGELHGALLATYFKASGVVLGSAFGGEVGTPLFRFARDRIRFAVRLAVDTSLLILGAGSGDALRWEPITLVAGPQLWVRLSAAAFFVVRTAGGMSVTIFNAPFGTAGVSPTVDGLVGFAFPLD